MLIPQEKKKRSPFEVDFVALPEAPEAPEDLLTSPEAPEDLLTSPEVLQGSECKVWKCSRR